MNYSTITNKKKEYDDQEDRNFFLYCYSKGCAAANVSPK